jgi:divalent anion:Na+ symporter, DASS family
MVDCTQAANPLAVNLAADSGVTITWSLWAKAAIVPGLLSLGLMPIVVYYVLPPSITNAADAPRTARRKLVSMQHTGGSITAY